jgi:DNA-binding MarR family transcriptional regulator
VETGSRDELGYLIKRVQQALRGAIDPALADIGLTMAQYALLYNLQLHPGASNADLARFAFVSPQAMVRVMAELERTGLLIRKASQAHARVLQAHLTPKGIRALAAAQRRVEDIHKVMLQGLSTSRVRALATDLAAVAEQLEGLSSGG